MKYTHKNHAKSCDAEGELRGQILAVWVPRVPRRAHQENEHRGGDEFRAERVQDGQFRVRDGGAETVLVVRVLLQNTQRRHHLKKHIISLFKMSK